MTTKSVTPDEAEPLLDRRGFLSGAATVTLGVTSLLAAPVQSAETTTPRNSPTFQILYWNGSALKNAVHVSGTTTPLTGESVRVTITPGPSPTGAASIFRGVNAYFTPLSVRTEAQKPVPFYAWTAPATNPTSFLMPLNSGLMFGVQQSQGETLLRLGGKSGLPLQAGTYLLAAPSAVPSQLLLRMEVDEKIDRPNVLRPVVRTPKGFTPANFEYLVIHLEDIA